LSEKHAFAVSAVLTDIEGTTSSISFVHEVLFPYALANVRQFLESDAGNEAVAKAKEQIAYDAGSPSLSAAGRNLV
jgi:enolase-phosphatase E1